MNSDISLIICTHNPREDYLLRTLDALRRQTLPREKWEMLVVDNCSTAPVEGRFDVSWHPHAHFIREDTLGLTAARLRGIRDARGDLLVFVDDDNVLDADYLDQVLRIAEEKPFLGSWCGQCRPEFDVSPPEWTRRYWPILCIRTFQSDLWSNIARLPETMPHGAGLSVRRAVAQQYLDLHQSGRRSIPLDRRGNSLVSGGDNDLAACACDLGLGVGLFARLKLTHLIPPQRLELNYLCRLVEGIEFSSVVLDAERGIEPTRRGMIGTFVDRLRVLRIRGPHRQILKATYRGRAAAMRTLTDGRIAYSQRGIAG